MASWDMVLFVKRL